MGWALLESLCSLMSLQSPASQLDDSVLEVGTVVVSGKWAHMPLTTQQANSGLFSLSHSGSRFQEQPPVSGPPPSQNKRSPSASDAERRVQCGDPERGWPGGGGGGAGFPLRVSARYPHPQVSFSGHRGWSSWGIHAL